MVACFAVDNINIQMAVVQVSIGAADPVLLQSLYVALGGELQSRWRVGGDVVRQESTPLLERLQFIAIASRNLDEFFAKRVGGLMRQVAAGTTDLKVGPAPSSSQQCCTVTIIRSQW